MNFTKVKEYTKIGQKRLCLPNGIDILSNGNIVGVCGGDNKLWLLNPITGDNKTVGELGYGECKFKEPVGVFVSPSDLVYVADWYNHRVVIYDDELKYQNEFGCYKRNGKNNILSFLKSIVAIVKHSAYKGSYLIDFEKNISMSESGYKAYLLPETIKYIKKKTGILNYLTKVYNGTCAVNKPNGICFVDNKTFVLTDKNLRTVTKYQVKNSDEGTQFFRKKKEMFNHRVSHICHLKDNPNFKFVLCTDEGNMLLLNHSLGTVSQEKNISPFSCCKIMNETLAIVEPNKLLFYDIEQQKILEENSWNGFLHDVEYNDKKNILYLCNRNDNKVEVLRLE